MRRTLLLTLLLSATAASPAVKAQWDIQDSGTKVSLRGIHSLGKGIAWASGTDGTVLRTEDGGYLWQRCTTPPGAEKLDFRGIQGFDANTAIVMSSGKGDLSRLYKTTDGCQTWTLLFTNHEEDGFFDALAFPYLPDPRHTGILLGDPVDGKFSLWRVYGLSATKDIPPEQIKHRPHASTSSAAFAASNSALLVEDPYMDYWFATGGKSGAHIYHTNYHWLDEWSFTTWDVHAVPVGSKEESSGVFSLSVHKSSIGWFLGVAVGGDYLKPDQAEKIAAFTTNSGQAWMSSTTQPHGYRSAVAYDASTKTWITVGPNGTDISTDDGRNWRALKPGPNDALDADKNWNALSLPFVVGPKGRIGVLRPDALKAPPSK
jgi:photosystem II stability/assembly factor-like uncharacterized protein